ncbi:MAG: xanthine dehydrogenase accessory protein XdhC [Gammaproteobacteria bacterium]|nr:xanthine dehydrogenase accessory protein XdhC [Gammaproteobacteria bacterium]
MISNDNDPALPRWLSVLPELVRTRCDFVMVTVAGARGSTPRPSGTRMLVTRDAIIDTIGGGQLEHRAVAVAHDWLDDNTVHGAQLRRFALGPALNQCCGGVADLLFEKRQADAWRWASQAASAVQAGQGVALATVLPPLSAKDKRAKDSSGPDCCSALINNPQTVCLGLESRAPGESSLAQWLSSWLDTDQGDAALSMKRAQLDGTAVSILIERIRPPDLQISLFGAGHVGRAIAVILATLPCALRWIDSRAGEFPAAALANNVQRLVVDTPSREVFAAPPGSYFLVMTHSHPLDEEICDAVLSRDDITYLGLIGSTSKARQFKTRLSRRGHCPARLARLICPIGIPGVGGKAPAEIAVAVVADILRRYTAAKASHSKGNT